MEINYELEISKEQFYGILKMVGRDQSDIEKLWVEYSSAFKHIVRPIKYSGTRYKGELVREIELNPKESEVTLITDTNKEVFWCECKNASADFILCELQRERDLDVSKY